MQIKLNQRLPIVLIRRIFLFLLVGVVYTFLHVWAFKDLLKIDLLPLVVDTALFYLFIAVAIIFLNRLLITVDIVFSENPYRFTKIAVLFVFFLLFVNGLNFLLLQNFFPSSEVELSKTYPFKLIVSLLFFVVTFIFSRLEKSKDIVDSEIEDYLELPIVVEQEESKNMEVIPKTVDRITVKNGCKIDFIYTYEIDYVQAYGDYVIIFCPKGRFVKEETMKNLQSLLPPSHFVRVHRSYIVNVERIAKIERYGKQNFIIILKNGEEVKVSANGYKLLKESIGL